MLKSKRNRRCGCGSGKKYRNCCDKQWNERDKNALFEWLMKARRPMRVLPVRWDRSVKWKSSTARG